MQVKQVVNSLLGSNTYIISEASSNWVLLIDIGNFKGVLECLSEDILIRGAFITHHHFYHIYGLNDLIAAFPDCIILASEKGKQGLYSDKLNLSYYHEGSTVFIGSEIRILNEHDKVELFENIYLETLETPGHNWSCLTYKVQNYIFTGDSYIPNNEVVTKLKRGNRDASKMSLQKIRKNIGEGTIICHGHGVMTRSSDSFLN